MHEPKRTQKMKFPADNQAVPVGLLYTGGYSRIPLRSFVVDLYNKLIHSGSTTEQIEVMELTHNTPFTITTTIITIAES